MSTAGPGQRSGLLAWLVLAAPLLILLSLVALLHRRGADRFAAVPPLLISSGLLATSAVARARHRRQLLAALRRERLE